MPRVPTSPTGEPTYEWYVGRLVARDAEMHGADGQGGAWERMVTDVAELKRDNADSKLWRARFGGFVAACALAGGMLATGLTLLVEYLRR